MVNKLDYMDIRLEPASSSSGVYMAGETVTGSLLASLQQSIGVESIEVSLAGEAHTSWVNKTSDKIYESTDQYVNEMYLLPYLHQVKPLLTLILA